jgi:hypothetical protein
MIRRGSPKNEMMATWIIQNADGEYLGEASALSPKVALCLYIAECGRSLGLSDITSEASDDGSHRLTCEGETYLVNRKA